MADSILDYLRDALKGPKDSAPPLSSAAMTAALSGEDPNAQAAFLGSYIKDALSQSQARLGPMRVAQRGLPADAENALARDSAAYSADWWKALRQTYGGSNPPDQLLPDIGHFAPRKRDDMGAAVWPHAESAWPPQYPVSPFTKPFSSKRGWQSNPYDNPPISDAPAGSGYEPFADPNADLIDRYRWLWSPPASARGGG